MRPERILAYTAIFGGYDDLKPAPRQPAVAFLDAAPARTRGWTPKIVRPFDKRNPARSNRFYKLRPHFAVSVADPTATHALYVDGSMRLLVQPEELLELFRTAAGRDAEIFTLRHSLGHTAADEGPWLEREQIVHPDVLREQRARYAELGVPPEIPIPEPRLILSRVGGRAAAFFELWWQEVRLHGHRDQLAYAYAAWRSGADVALYEGSWRPLFKRHAHLKPQLRSAK